MMDIMKLMKQVQDMQGKVAAVQESLAQTTVTGQAGGGLVTVTMDGRGEMRGVKIDPSLMSPKEVELLEDLVLAATGDAKAKAEAVSQSKMKDVTAGLPIPPGMSFPGMKF